MVVGQLRNGRAAGATGKKAEHLKEWLANITLEEREEGGVEGLGDRWWSFAALLQADHGDRTHPDDLDDFCPAAEGRRQFSQYWPTRPHLEGHGESHGSSILSHQAPRLRPWRTS